MWWNLVPSVIISEVEPLGGDNLMRKEPLWMGLLSSQETPESSLPYTMWRHGEKMNIYEKGSEPSLVTEYAGTLILDFLAFKILKNNFLLFIIHSVYGILLYWNKTL